jgi:hypothetical protein
MVVAKPNRTHEPKVKMTRFLKAQIWARLVPLLQAHGFEPVRFSLNRKDEPVNVEEICTERTRGDYIDTVYVMFAKYSRPTFQVGFSRRLSQFPNEWVRAGNLVKNPNQYFCFWGKKWWIPNALWSDARASATVEAVTALTDQIFEFLDTGAKGKNISRKADVRSINADVKDLE